jgi:hypothetical protein
MDPVTTMSAVAAGPNSAEHAVSGWSWLRWTLPAKLIIAQPGTQQPYLTERVLISTTHSGVASGTCHFD